MTEQTVTGAVARRQTPAVEAQLSRHVDWFGQISPSHMPAAQLVQLAVAQYRKDATLAAAADANPGSFMVAVAECARLGLVPGDTFHLVGFNDKNAPGGKSVVGITDYKGEVELAYRSGEVESLHCEVVRARDEFRWDPTTMRLPHHEIKANEHGQVGLGSDAERGPLSGVYAYARMRDGAISQVVVLPPSEVVKHQAVAKTDKFWGPPWPREGPWTPAMWRKTAMHVLQPWIPTSPEYMHAKVVAQSRFETAMPAELTAAYQRQGEDGAPDLGEPGPSPRTIQGTAEATGRAPSRDDNLARFDRVLGSLGMDGDELAADRFTLLRIMAAPDGPPLTIRTPKSMTAAQAATAVATLQAAVDKAGEEAPAMLLRIARAVTSPEGNGDQ